MSRDKVKIHTPYEVDGLVVYLESEELAHVIDYDCRYELTTTPTSCDCCTFIFRSRFHQGFQCRHIKALRSILGLS
ncbi:hypothetical protein [Desulfofalx alkaliphila]|uniref:hypothetical protein n=1 Tax=Desulfofalx alkaliphila TaxID=105483 RepID=UPI0004E243E0|nr:hypothetical protein [Desulfofalx alkaliphila]